MMSSGGVASVHTAAERPVTLLLSGPAAGILGGQWAGALAGRRRLITFDMGGTSADIGIVTEDGVSEASARDTWVGGYPLLVPMLDVHAIGAGGGSIAYVDEGGAFRVGPRSAGAVARPRLLRPRRPGADDHRRARRPRPARPRALPRRPDEARPRRRCRRRPEARRPARPRPARDGRGDPHDRELEHGAGDPLADDREGPRPARVRARRIRRRRPAARRPRSPTRSRSQRCSCRRTPASPPPAACSRATSSTTRCAPSSSCRAASTSSGSTVSWTSSRRSCAVWLERDGVPADDVEVIRALDCRYVGQGYELRVTLADGPFTEQALDQFHVLHEREYGSAYGDPIEIVNARVTAIGRRPALESLPVASGSLRRGARGRERGRLPRRRQPAGAADAASTTAACCRSTRRSPAPPSSSTPTPRPSSRPAGTPRRTPPAT